MKLFFAKRGVVMTGAAAMMMAGALFFMPGSASAATSVVAPNLWKTPPGYWGPLLSCTGQYLDSSGHPVQDGTQDTFGRSSCSDLNDLLQTIINILYFGISVALFLISPTLMVAGAIMLMVGGANPEMLGKGKKTMTGTVVGIGIILCSYAIVNGLITALHVVGVTGFGGQ